jgi:voltage-gated potassium channel
MNTLAVATGIVSAEFASHRVLTEVGTCSCLQCGNRNYAAEAKYCSECGAALP